MLACDYDILRIGAIQCCIKLLSADSQFAEKLLQSDISGDTYFSVNSHVN